MLDFSGKLKRLLPYVTLAIVGVIFFLFYYFGTGEIKDISSHLFSDDLFFFIAFIFFDLIHSSIRKKEKEYIEDYIKNRVTNDIFAALYFQKKIIHGYNLETNTIENIISIVNYSKSEIKNAVINQRYLGFQIFKGTDEMRSLFEEVLNNNLVLKYSSHLETINLLRIANNLSLLEITLKNGDNFNQSHPDSSEFVTVYGKDINPSNPDGYLLLRKAPHKDRFVVYDSGSFEKSYVNKLLTEYVLKKEAAEEIAVLLYGTFTLMKSWMPDVLHLRKDENRFRVIKKYFSAATKIKSGKNEVYVADIIESKKQNHSNE